MLWLRSGISKASSVPSLVLVVAVLLGRPSCALAQDTVSAHHKTRTIWELLGLDMPGLKDDRPGWVTFFTREEYRQFIAYVQNYFHDEGMAASVHDGTVVIDRDREQLGRLGLMNLAQLCHQLEKKQWKEAVTKYFNTVRREKDGERDLSRKIARYEAISNLLAVRIWPSDYLHALPKGIVSRQDLEGTISVLVFDLPTTARAVRAEEAAQWGKSEQELFETGLANIQKRYLPAISQERFGQGIIVTLLEGNDLFVASHALLIEHYPTCLGGYGTLLAIPHRQALLCYPINDLRVISAMHMLAPIIQRMQEEGQGSISSSLYWYDQNRFIDLPYTMIGSKLELRPPEPFVTMLNQLLPSATSESDGG